MPLFLTSSAAAAAAGSAARAASGRAASSSSPGAHAAVAVPDRRRRSSNTPNATSSPSQLARRLGRRRLSVAPSSSSPSLPAPKRLCPPLRSLGEDRDGIFVELEEEDDIEWWSETARDDSGATLAHSSSAAGAAMLGFFLSALAASAAEGAAAAANTLPAKIPYDPTAGSDFLRNVAGAAYVVLLVVFAFRLLRRRADFATSTRIARGGSGAKAAADGRNLTPEQRRQNYIADQASEVARRKRQPAVRATPLRAAVGALQAAVCAVLLWQVCTRVDAFFETSFELPEGYTAHNIAVTLRTVGRGLSYLLTFIFAANAAGLGGLAVQLVFYPDPELVVEEDEEEEVEVGGGGEAGAFSAAATAMTAASSSGNADEDDAAALRPPSPSAAALSSEDESK